MSDDIREFQGKYRWLSNFWPCLVTLDGVEYPSVENAYQASKTLDFNARLPFQTYTAVQAKRAGRRLGMRQGWETYKLSVMEELNRQKYLIPELRSNLLATGVCQIVEGNHWGDTFWGVCKGAGDNMLGKILMRIRDDLRVQEGLKALGEFFYE